MVWALHCKSHSAGGFPDLERNPKRPKPDFGVDIAKIRTRLEIPQISTLPWGARQHARSSMSSQESTSPPVSHAACRDMSVVKRCCEMKSVQCPLEALLLLQRKGESVARICLSGAWDCQLSAVGCLQRSGSCGRWVSGIVRWVPGFVSGVSGIVSLVPGIANQVSGFGDWVSGSLSLVTDKCQFGAWNC